MKIDQIKITCIFFILLFSSSAYAEELGDPYILKRGYVHLARQIQTEARKVLDGTEYIDYYMGERIPNKSIQMLTVVIPPPKMADQYVLATFLLDCKNGASKFTNMQAFDASWNLRGTIKNIKSEKWERNAPGTVNAHLVEVGCGKN